MKKELLYSIAVRLYPRLLRFPESERYLAAGYVLRSLIFIPPTLIGVAWLISVTDPAVVQQHWFFLLILFGFLVIFSTLWLEIYFVTTSGGYRSERRSFWGEAMWSGVLVFGPTVGWLGLILPWVTFWLQQREGGSLHKLRIFSQSIFRMSVLLPTLVEVAVYERLGGQFPIRSLNFPDVFPAIVATLIGFTLGSLMITVSQGFSRIMLPVSAAQRAKSLQLAVFVILLGPMAGLIAILPASLYNLAGWGAYFGFLGIMLGGTFIVDRMSRTAEHARRRTRELEQLQNMSQLLLQGAPDEARLSSLLERHVPNILPNCHIAIRLYPEQTLLSLPNDWIGPDVECWDWEKERTMHLMLQPRDIRPWLKGGGREGIIIMPVIQPRTQRILGRLYLHREQQINTLQHLLPAVQLLADQIASTHYSTELYQQSVTEQVRRGRMAQELTFARTVQTSFLPTVRPNIPGWQFAATLEPARETSGDYFDFIPLHGGRLGIVVADVADKGLGAALYMALSRTLIRAYAIDYALRYSQTYLRQLAHLIQTVNSRILSDTQNDLFVTVFFGVLDPPTGILTYVNAGHNPPYLLRYQRGRRIKSLRRTGPPLGMMEDFHWSRRSVQIEEGETLVLYTDGLTEAANDKGEFFGENGLQQTLRASLRFPVEQMCSDILRSVIEFEQGAPRADDITLMIMRRDIENKLKSGKSRAKKSAL